MQAPLWTAPPEECHLVEAEEGEAAGRRLSIELPLPPGIRLAAADTTWWEAAGGAGEAEAGEEGAAES